MPISRVQWPPAFIAGPRNEVARRFCCRRPTSILPPVRLFATPVQSIQSSSCCRPDAFHQRRCSTLVIVILGCVRAALPACEVLRLSQHARCSSRSASFIARAPKASHTVCCPRSADAQIVRSSPALAALHLQQSHREAVGRRHRAYPVSSSPLSRHRHVQLLAASCWLSQSSNCLGSRRSMHF